MENVKTIEKEYKGSVWESALDKAFRKAKKDVKNKRYGIYRVDFNNQEELIGYLPFNSSKIREE